MCGCSGRLAEQPRAPCWAAAKCPSQTLRLRLPPGPRAGGEEEPERPPSLCDPQRASLAAPATPRRGDGPSDPRLHPQPSDPYGVQSPPGAQGVGAAPESARHLPVRGEAQLRLGPAPASRLSGRVTGPPPPSPVRALSRPLGSRQPAGPVRGEQAICERCWTSARHARGLLPGRPLLPGVWERCLPTRGARLRRRHTRRREQTTQWLLRLTAGLPKPPPFHGAPRCPWTVGDPPQGQPSLREGPKCLQGFPPPRGHSQVPVVRLLWPLVPAGSWPRAPGPGLRDGRQEGPGGALGLT